MVSLAGASPTRPPAGTRAKLNPPAGADLPTGASSTSADGDSATGARPPSPAGAPVGRGGVGAAVPMRSVSAVSAAGTVALGRRSTGGISRVSITWITLAPAKISGTMTVALLISSSVNGTGPPTLVKVTLPPRILTVRLAPGKAVETFMPSVRFVDRNAPEGMTWNDSRAVRVGMSLRVMLSSSSVVALARAACASNAALVGARMVHAVVSLMAVARPAKRGWRQSLPGAKQSRRVRCQQSAGLERMCHALCIMQKFASCTGGDLSTLKVFAFNTLAR